MAQLNTVGSLSSWRAWIEINTPHPHRVIMCPSLSSWRAWIEMVEAFCFIERMDGSLSSWRAWIEIDRIVEHRLVATSLSSWRAWIEIGFDEIPG